MRILRSVAPFALPAALAAQAFTSPAGLLTTEGSSNHDYILFKYDDMRWQQLDETSMGQSPVAIQRIAWRRDGTAGVDPTWVARSIDISVYLADAVTPAGVSLDFDLNYASPPTNVFLSRTVNLPDWTQPPAAAPAPFDLVLQLDVPWVYTGQRPFLWEVQSANHSIPATNDYGNDFQSTSGTTGTSTSGTVLGTGCVAGGQTSSMSLTGSARNQISRLELSFAVARGPASTPLQLFVDVADANLTLPGLCTAVHALPTINVALGTTDATGSLPAVVFGNIPLPRSAYGAPLVTQTLGVDPSQPAIPLALSNGRRFVIPQPPATPAPVTRLYSYRLSNGTIRAASAWTGGIVARFD